MKNFIRFATLLLLFLSNCIYAQKIASLTSPDGKIRFEFKNDGKSINYSVSYNNSKLLDNSPIGLKFQDGVFQSNISMGKPVMREATEEYDLVIGKTKHVSSRYKELAIPLTEKTSPQHKIQLVVRAFNDGVAFRYLFPEQSGRDTYELLEENSMFRLTGNPTLLALFLPSYTSSHEGLYNRIAFKDVKEDTLIDMPLLIEYPGHIYMAITEAALHDYAGMYLSRNNDMLVSKLSPLPGQTAVKVKARLPHKSPWRVMLISDRVGELIESNILTSLNEPNKISDISWIRPGKTTFPWWNGNVTPDSSFAPGNNFETNKYYIDFCARNGIEYHSVVEYGLHQWYVDDGEGFQPGPHSDVTRAVPGLDMKAICDYAKQKGVDIRVWVYWSALYPKIDTAFEVFEKWGLSGMMVDFMDRDDQEMVNIQEEILEKAAKHKLHIQFHGAYKPTGMHRTWPNEYTREGTLNYENNKWNPEPISPSHDLNIVFTRMLAGPSDYHMGGFRAVPPSKYKVQYTRPLMVGTRCHMLAMYVVLESYLGMVCDYPAAYEGEPGFEFVKSVPTVWDETKVLDAAVGNFITIARRKQNDWFIGSISNENARDLQIDLSFLPAGNFQAEIYSDANDTNANPNHLEKQTKTITNKDKISLHLAAGGGAAIHIRMK